jgi:hypothetical protein
MGGGWHAGDILGGGMLAREFLSDFHSRYSALDLA